MKFHLSTTGQQPPTRHDTAVFMPGWGFDHRIFGGRLTCARAVYPLDGVDADFARSLADFIADNDLHPVTLYGWSMGGAMAFAFAAAYPDLVRQIIAAGVRPSYPADELDAFRSAVRSDACRCLTDHYRRCFLPSQRDDFRRFNSTLGEAYISRISIDNLLGGLDILQANPIDAKSLTNRPATLLHGAKDIVSPVSEITEIASTIGINVVVIDDASHAVFMHPKAAEVWTHGG